jgi:hypothetical protein
MLRRCGDFSLHLRPKFARGKIGGTLERLDPEYGPLVVGLGTSVEISADALAARVRDYDIPDRIARSASMRYGRVALSRTDTAGCGCCDGGHGDGYFPQ